MIDGEWDVQALEIIDNIPAPDRNIRYIEDENASDFKHPVDIGKCTIHFLIEKVFNQTKCHHLIKRAAVNGNFPRISNNVDAGKRIDVIADIAGRRSFATTEF